MPNLDQLPSYQRKSDSNNNCSKINVIKKHFVNVYYVMGFRSNYFTCTAHLYLYYTYLYRTLMPPI